MSWDILVSPILDLVRHLTRSKVSIKIEGLSLAPHTYEDIEGCEDIEGFTGYVRVTNKGKKIAYNLTAEIGVDNGWAYVEVLDGCLMADARKRIRFRKLEIQDMHKDHARKTEYEWIDEKKNSCGSIFKKLRQNDFVFLSFPVGHEMHIGWPATYHRSLHIARDTEHNVVITVKAEDPEKNTVSATRKFKFTIAKDFVGSLFIP